MRWFRMYAELLHDNKTRALNDRDFRWWVTMLCVACDRGGSFTVEDVKALTGHRLDHCQQAASRLLAVGLLSASDGASGCASDGALIPSGWQKRQYTSDISTDRVRRHRGKRNVSDAVSETPPETDTDTDKILATPDAVPAPLVEPPPEPDVWRDGVRTVMRLTGKSEPAVRSFLGKCVKQLGGDHDAVMAILVEAEAQPALVNASAWIAGAVKNRSRENEQPRSSGGNVWIKASRSLSERRERLRGGGDTTGRGSSDPDDDGGRGGCQFGGGALGDGGLAFARRGAATGGLVLDVVGEDTGRQSRGILDGCVRPLFEVPSISSGKHH